MWDSELWRRPRRHCCWIYSCAVTAACVIIFFATFLLFPVFWKIAQPEDVKNISKRFAHHHVHHWKDADFEAMKDTNLWYSYAKMIAHEKNRSNCFVCSVMPKSSLQPDVYGIPMPEPLAICFSFLTLSGYNPGLMALLSNRTLFIRFNYTCKNSSCFNCSKTQFTDDKVIGAVRENKVKPQTVWVSSNARFPLCFKVNETGGKMNVGLFNESRCDYIVQNHSPYWSHRARWGTIAAEGGWWYCGKQGYPALPRNWSGLCTPIFLTDHTLIVSLRHVQETHNRKRRELVAPTFKPHDSVWGTDVPPEHKHWSDSSKVGFAFLPWTGVAKNMLRLETIDYRFKTFVNLSIDINKGQNRELDALRMMVLQNRMVLDMLTAAQGGVCVLINTTCCTFVPDEVNGDVAQAMASLRNLRDVMTKDKVPETWTFWSWLTGGAWWHIMLKFLTPVIVVLTLFCFLMCCVIPCVKAMIHKAVSHAFYQQVSTDDALDEEPHKSYDDVDAEGSQKDYISLSESHHSSYGYPETKLYA